MVLAADVGGKLGDALQFALVLSAAAIMAKIEKRKLRYYGLPLTQMFRGNLWKGCLWGFGAISVLLLILRADRNFYFGGPELSRWSALHFALLWAIAFLFVGHDFCERHSGPSGVSPLVLPLVPKLLFGNAGLGNSVSSPLDRSDSPRVRRNGLSKTQVPKQEFWHQGQPGSEPEASEKNLCSRVRL